MRTVYIVGHNMPGYLPDSDPYIVGSKRDAIRASREDAERDRADMGIDSDPARLSGRAGDYYVSHPDSGPSYHYWVTPCTADLVTLTGDGMSWPYSRYRCANCETELSAGDRAYQVTYADAYVCRDCIGGGR